MCGWEDGEWGVEAVLARLRSTEDEEILDSEELIARDERRSEELEALESVFGERFFRSTEDPSHFSIDIPHLDPSSSTNTNDDLTLHLIFPSSPIASPYPSTRYATSPPTFYVTSTTLPSYIRLHLHSLLLTLFHRLDREDLRSTLESGEGGIVFALVEFLENEWEAIVQEPPSVGIVTQHLVPKLPPPKKVEGEVFVKKVAPVKRNFNQGARREPTMQEQEGLKSRTEEWQRSEKFKKVLEGRMSLPAWKSKGEVLDALEKNRVLVVVGEVSFESSFFVASRPFHARADSLVSSVFSSRRGLERLLSFLSSFSVRSTVALRCVFDGVWKVDSALVALRPRDRRPSRLLDLDPRYSTPSSFCSWSSRSSGLGTSGRRRQSFWTRRIRDSRREESWEGYQAAVLYDGSASEEVECWWGW